MTIPPAPRSDGQQGVVLLVVLWTMALLALLAAHFLASGRTEIQLVSSAREAMRVEAAADGAVYEAVWRLADGAAAHWPADRVPRETRVGGIPVTVVIENLAGRINPNTAPGDLIAAVLIHLGMASERALAQGAAIFDWHMPGRIASPGGAKLPAYRAAGLSYGPPGQPFETDDEIGAVVGMNQTVAAALLPLLSIYNDGAIEPRFAAPVVRLALQETGTNQPSGQSGFATVEIMAVARLPDGTVFQRRAVVRFHDREPFQILEWTSAE